MFRIVGFWCVLSFHLFGSTGSPITSPQGTQAILGNESQLKGTNSEKIQQLYNLLNESILQETLSEFALHANLERENEEVANPDGIAIELSTDRLYTSKPNFAGSVEDNIKSEESKIIPQTLNFLDRVGVTTTAPIQEAPNQNPPKSPLEYQSQRPTYAGALGGISGGHLGQLIPSGSLLPAYPPNMAIQDRVKETTTAINIQELSSQKPPMRPPCASAPGDILGSLWPFIPPTQNISIEDGAKKTSTTSRTIQEQSPLEYKPQRPSYASVAGGLSEGYLGQLIPSGSSLPVHSQKQNVTIKDRLKKNTTVQELSTLKPITVSPLEYQPQRTPFAGSPGGISGGHLGSLIPPGKPWPADLAKQNISIEDRAKETTIGTTTNVQKLPSTKPITKSPLAYQSQRPTFAGAPGGISGGHLGPLIPPGKPWPADPPKKNITLEDRFQETTTIAQDRPSQKTTTKSPLEYQTQRPSFAGSPGGISGGHLGSLIPPGKPWPANLPKQNISIEDRVKETTIAPTTNVQKLPSTKTTTMSPLAYQPQRPTYTGAPGGISGGHLGPLIPPGKPWPADPPKKNITLDDRFKETTTIAQDRPSQKTTTKSPLEYQTSRPSFAGDPGGISGGQLGQLVPPGNPWPANSSKQNITIEDRVQETTITPTTVKDLSQKPTTKAPLIHQLPIPTIPTLTEILGAISGGPLSPFKPPAIPWLTEDKQTQRPAFGDRFTDTTFTQSSQNQPTTTSSLAYKPQKPSFAGQLSNGDLGQLIAPGKPWPAS